MAVVTIIMKDDEEGSNFSFELQLTENPTGANFSFELQLTENPTGANIFGETLTTAQKVGIKIAELVTGEKLGDEIDDTQH